MALSLTSLLIFAAVTQGYTTFEVQCTSPSTTVNFVSSADKRGTMDILLGCLFTLIACTWTVQHLNVPEQREGRDPGLLGNIKWTLKRTWTSTKWMLFTVLAPEFLLAKSITDLEAVDSSITQLQELAAQDGVPWTRVHSLFANMGGFVIKVDIDTTRPKPSATVSYSSPYHLAASDVLVLRQEGVLDKLPSIAEEELNDKSKSDSLVRTVTTVQIAWMIFQIIVRATRHLAISQLEVSVLAFACCAIVIYGLNWEKPKGVQVPYTLVTYQGEIPASVLRHLEEQKRESALDALAEELKGIGGPTPKDKLPGAPLRNHVSYFKVNSKTWVDFYGLLIGTIIFGAVHLTAWNFVFPTSTERTVWRVASIFCALPMILILGYAVIFEVLEEVETLSSSRLYKYADKIIWTVLTIFVCFGYIVARLFMIVETFRTLLFLPPSAYIATWASNVPHIA
jgi:hypothetical protein